MALIRTLQAKTAEHLTFFSDFLATLPASTVLFMHKKSSVSPSGYVTYTACGFGGPLLQIGFTVADYFALDPSDISTFEAQYAMLESNPASGLGGWKYEDTGYEL